MRHVQVSVMLCLNGTVVTAHRTELHNRWLTCKHATVTCVKLGHINDRDVYVSLVNYLDILIQLFEGTNANDIIMQRALKTLRVE